MRISTAPSSSGYRRYLGNASAATHDQAVGILAGACLGGGTVVNYTTSFRTPDDVREEWARHGVPAFTSETFTRSLDVVCERIGVNLDHNRRSRREELVHQGLAQLGWHEDAQPRNVRGCDQGLSCGYCPYGCRLGAKQSTVKTWLVDAYCGRRPHPRGHVRRARRSSNAARPEACRPAQPRGTRCTFARERSSSPAGRS